MNVELIIASEDGKKFFQPVVEEGIELSLQRRDSPGKLTFKVLQDDVLDFSEGSAVRLKVDDAEVFYGFVFTKSRDKGKLVSVTAYDQLRYLQNKDTYVYEKKTASQFLKMLANDFNLNLGTIEDTKFVIPSRVEDNTSLFDMIGNALDLTLQNTGEMFVLYDDFGKLTLKNVSNMYVGDKASGLFLLVDDETAEDYEYESSIDSDTYDKIKLTYENEKTGKREIYIAQDSSNINKWGVLQYFDTLSKGENGKAKADALLKLYNTKTRSLKLKKCFGDTRVRGGSLIVVNLTLDDVKVQNFMLVEEVKHTFSLDSHFMDLTLRGGEFNVA